MPINTGCRDHPLGSNPEGYIPQLSSLWGYPSSDTNLEGPKGISNRNGGASQARTLLLYCDEMYSPGPKCKEQKFFQIDVSTSSSYEDKPSDEAPDPEDVQPSVHAEDSVSSPVVPEEPVISLHALLGISAP
jgi:hypothetical protein